MDEEHWDINDSDTLALECERCGESRPCQLVHDPFETEGIVEPADHDDPEDHGKRHWWCKPCWDQRLGDV